MDTKDEEAEKIMDFFRGFGNKPENKKTQDDWMLEHYPALFRKDKKYEETK